MATKLTYTLPQGFTHLTRLRSYTAHANFLAQCYDDVVGIIQRRQEIPSPYAYSPDWVVFRTIAGNKLVIIRETTHRVFDVIQVPNELVTFNHEKA